jgi:hypothetical protein
MGCQNEVVAEIPKGGDRVLAVRIRRGGTDGGIVH